MCSSLEETFAPAAGADAIVEEKEACVTRQDSFLLKASEPTTAPVGRWVISLPALDFKAFIREEKQETHLPVS